MIPQIDWRTKSATTAIPHDIHPTSLEQFMACPYKHNQADKLPPTSITWREAFYEWDITEQLMTAYQYGDKLWDQVLMNFWNSTEFPLYSRLQKHAQNWKEYVSNADINIQQRFPLFTQKRMSLDILMDSNRDDCYHEFHLVWTADRVYSDYTIADCKTAKSKRWKNEADFRLQRRLYPRMWRETSHLPSLKNKDTFDFTYYVFTKQVTPQLQIIPLTYSYEDSERLIFHLLHEYAKAYDEDAREPKKCLWCKRCPLRQQCPLYAEDWMASFTATNTDDDTERRF